MELALKDIEHILNNESTKYKYYDVYHNDKFIYSLKFDNGNIIEIKDNTDIIAKYVYSKSGVIISETIIYPDGEMYSLYKIERKGSIAAEYRTRILPNDIYLSKASSNIKYEYGNISNKYLKKYHLDGLKSIYKTGILYTVKCLDNGFEVYDDMVPVYKELYDDKDNLIYSYMIDYNCMQNTFKYNDDNKISEQLVYSNKSLLYKIFYKYNDNNLLNQETIYHQDSMYNICYYYDSDGFIYKITSDSDTYDFKYHN